jgi:hypothetical protein
MLMILSFYRKHRDTLNVSVLMFVLMCGESLTEGILWLF